MAVQYNEETKKYEFKDNVSYIHLKSLLSYKNCPVDLLETFSTSEDVSLRIETAKNENCPENILFELSNDEEWEVRSTVALNKKTPENVLIKLSQDKLLDVRFNFVLNPSATNKALEWFYNNDYYQDYSNNDDYFIYFTVKNPNCSADLLEKIFSKNLNNFDYISLQEHLKRRGDLEDMNNKTKGFAYSCAEIINHPNSTPELKDKVIQKLLDTTLEPFDINSIIPSVTRKYDDSRNSAVNYFDKIDFYYYFMKNNLEILNNTKKMLMN